MTMTAISRPLRSLAKGATLGLALAAMTFGVGPVQAQGLFSPAIRVNDKSITPYQIQQREMFLQVLNAPGNLRALAREQLIDDALKFGLADQLGLVLQDDAVAQGMEEFAQRANLSSEQLVAQLGNIGIAEETFSEFIRSQIIWREVVRARYASRVDISEDEIDRAIASQAAGGGMRVLISEIFIPTGNTPQQAQQAQQIAAQISEIDSVDAFAAAARQYSAAQSRDSGGRVDWAELGSLPGPLRSALMNLNPGDVTQPIPVQGAIALFQLRAIEETGAREVSYSAIDYAAYYINGGRSPEGLARAAEVRASVDTCDDLYGIAKGQPESVLERGSHAPGEIPTDIAVELAKLDPNEVSTSLTRSNGQTLVFLMLCGRTPSVVAEADIDRAQVANALQNQRLGSYADSYIAQLRSEARIVEVN